MDWKEQAKTYFLKEHEPVGTIAEKTGVSRQSVSAYLKTLPGYHAEKARRKAESMARRREYKRQKNREYRSAVNVVTGETMRREHDIAALVLSRERYY